MKRGDVVIVAAGSGFGGKPRPALVVQSDAFDDLNTVVVALFTSDATDAPSIRPRFEPDAANGLRETSYLMIDILVTARHDRIGKVVGHLAPADLARADRAILVFLGLAG